MTMHVAAERHASEALIYEGTPRPWGSWSSQAWLTWHLALRHLAIRYQGSALGFLWTVLNPLLTMLLFTFVFSMVLRVTVPGVPYAAYFITGFLLFQAFSVAVSSNVNIILENQAVIANYYIPLHVLPLSRVVSSFINLMATMPLLFVFFVVLRVEPSWRMLAMPAPILLLFLGTVGLALCVTVMATHYRDVAQLLEPLLVALHFSAPIYYPYAQASESLKGFWLLIYDCNPLAGVVSIAHWCMFGLPLAPRLLVSGVAGPLIFFVFGCWLFARHRHRLISLT